MSLILPQLHVRAEVDGDVYQLLPVAGLEHQRVFWIGTRTAYPGEENDGNPHARG